MCILLLGRHMSKKELIAQLQAENASLRQEINRLKEEMSFSPIANTVVVPEKFKAIFDEAERNVREYFSDVYNSAENGEIVIHDERYILVRSAALSYEFLDIIKEMYRKNGSEEALRIGNNFLFDIGHVLGIKDSRVFHQKMNLTEPIQKLSAGPVHFAFTGWANVEILPESNPTPDEHFFLKYHHHNSWEAQSWIKAGRRSDRPVCIMNCGYSSGWCEESFGMHLTAVEITCEAHGDDHCTFIMAPPNKIQEYLQGELTQKTIDQYEVPMFFERKVVEDKLRESLQQKETLLKEVHHRVKNNLQIISSLFKLQLNNIEDESLKEIFLTSLNRVNTMAQVHELIYSDKDLASIPIEHYFRHLLTSLTHLYHSKDVEVKMIFDFDLVQGNFDPDKAIPLGLILNEIASNSFKYAFKKGGTFRLSLVEEDGHYLLTIGDNGPGLPKDKNEHTLGLSLITILSEQIDAELKIDSSPDGLIYTIRFSK